MKKFGIKTHEMGEALFSSIIFLIFGIFLITEPVNLIKVCLYVFGSFITLVGIFKLLLYYKESNGNKRDIISGGFFILLGMGTIICTIAFYEHLETVFRLILSIYLLYVGINRLVYAFKVKTRKQPYFLNAAAIILIAILLAAIPGLPLMVVGIFVTLYAICEIIGYVIGRKDKSDDGVSEAVVVNEQVENKNKEDVKLLK